MDPGQLSLEAFRPLYGSGDIVDFDGVCCLRTRHAPDVPMLNRIVGLGVDRPATAEQLDEAIAAMCGTSFYVSVEPGARPDAIEAWLSARGFEPGWGWMSNLWPRWTPICGR